MRGWSTPSVLPKDGLGFVIGEGVRGLSLYDTTARIEERDKE